MVQNVWKKQQKTQIFYKVVIFTEAAVYVLYPIISQEIQWQSPIVIKLEDLFQ